MGCKMQVISMTEGKITQDYISGHKIIVKQSSFDEIKKIECARKILEKRKIKIGNEEFSFHLPKINGYKNGKIYMEFLVGDNLEISLRSSEDREKAINTTNTLFQYFYDNKIYWGDFAPRNIIINKKNRIINLCDFERGIYSNFSGKEYLQNYAYEEYAAFLFPVERRFSEKLNSIFTVEEIIPVKISDIRSKRVKSIIKEIGIAEKKLTNQTVANINKMIILSETPYKRNGISEFPIVRLEQIKDNSYELFAKEVRRVLIARGYYHGKDREL